MSRKTKETERIGGEALPRKRRGEARSVITSHKGSPVVVIHDKDGVMRVRLGVW